MFYPLRVVQYGNNTHTHGLHLFSNGARTHSPEDVIAEVLAEVPNKAESPSRRAKTISTIILRDANDDVNDGLHVWGKGGVDGLTYLFFSVAVAGAT